MASDHHAPALRARVAIVGRPNVGKSTLFNRLLGKKRAAVLDLPGVTRDRHYADTLFYDRAITLIDTGGFIPGDEADKLSKLVRLQAQAAVEECHLVLFVVDGQTGPTPSDSEVARDLRKAQRPVVLVVNKSDHHKLDDEVAAPFFSLGLGEPMTVSAEHALGIETLKERVLQELPGLPLTTDGGAPEEPQTGFKAPRGPLRLAIVGRPNVARARWSIPSCGASR